MTLKSSKHFAKVPEKLAVTLPKKLLHKQVLQSPLKNNENNFSEERGHLVKIVDLPSTILSMTIGQLTANQATRLHRHNYETIIYVLHGKGKSLIETEEVFWEQGDAIYIPVWAWHSHVNLSDETCTYIACESAPLLQNLNIALREEN